MFLIAIVVCAIVFISWISSESYQLKCFITPSIDKEYRNDKYNIDVNKNSEGKYDIELTLDNEQLTSKYQCYKFVNNLVEKLIKDNIEKYKKIASLSFLFYNNDVFTYKVQIKDINDTDNIIENLIISSENGEKIEYSLTEYNNDHTQFIADSKTEGKKNLTEIINAYQNNSLSADDTYKENKYTIYAKIRDMDEDGILNNISDSITLTLETEIDNVIYIVYCIVQNSDRDKILEYNKGDYILISGICQNWNTWAECKIID